ncbi:unnamed protein product, partial [Mesorhabditis belari]|uniref:Protein kinase domain-containing protein n=1 Tax=Mesorhabditis belari TaxID=2138241 RepID=A0AAF3FDV1_9BILA
MMLRKQLLLVPYKAASPKTHHLTWAGRKPLGAGTFGEVWSIEYSTLLHCQRKTGEKHLLDVRICDFGSARHFEHTTTFPVEGGSEGTEMYWAPETFYERKTCHRTDIFQLGTVLYELVERSNCLLNEESGEPPLLSCDGEIQKLVYICTRSSYEQRASHAQEVEARLDAMLQACQQNGAGLELEVEELSGRGQDAPETPTGVRPPQTPDFSWLFQPLTNNLAAETFTERIKGDAGCEDADFHRQYFRESGKYDGLSQIDLQIGQIVDQHMTNYANLNYAGLLKSESEMQRPSHNLRFDMSDNQRFEEMLIADSNYQAKLFEQIFEVLIDTAKVPKVPKVPKSSRNLNSETHFSYGCWDLFELLEERRESLVKFIEFGYLIEFEFDCFIIRTNSGPKPCTFLAGDHTGSLFKYEENGVKVLFYLEGETKSERILANPPRTTIGCVELQELVANGMKQLHKATISYHSSLNKEFRFEVENYTFRLKWPPSHKHNCNGFIPSQLIQKPGFPKEISPSERIGICRCIQGCPESESLIEVYTKICKLFFFVKRKGVKMLKTPYEGRPLKIRFDEIRQHHDWRFHWHETEKRLILDHPESYDQSSIEMSFDCDHVDHVMSIMSIDCHYGFECLPVSENQLEKQRKTLGVHELFNVNQHPNENIFFRFGPN